jgi:hypothetical protein
MSCRIKRGKVNVVKGTETISIARLNLIGAPKSQASLLRRNGLESEAR